MKIFLLGVLVVNATVLGLAVLRFGFVKCDWCSKRYWYGRSTSSFPFVFCSYRCNFWDMRDFMATQTPADLADVEQVLARRGWIHPDHVSEVKR